MSKPELIVSLLKLCPSLLQNGQGRLDMVDGRVRDADLLEICDDARNASAKLGLLLQ